MPEPIASRLLTRVELAAAFHVHPATVTTWDESGMPCAQRGRRGTPSLYALQDAVKWHIHRECVARGVGDNGRLDPATERAKLDARRREEIEFRMAVKQGLYVRAFDVERCWASRIVVARDSLRGLPSRVKLRLPSLTASELGIIAEEIVHALNELADQPAHEDEAPEEETYATNGNRQGAATRRHGAADSDPLAAALP